jgi:hypothetical protein
VFFGETLFVKKKLRAITTSFLKRFYSAHTVEYRGNKFTLNGLEYTQAGIKKVLLETVPEVIDQARLAYEIADSDTSRDVFVQKMIAIILERARRQQREKVADVVLKKTRIDYNKIGLAIDKDTNETIVYDLVEGYFIQWDGPAFIASLPTALRKEFPDPIPCRLEFDPLNLEPSWTEKFDLGSQEIDLQVINSHLPPDYRHLKVNSYLLHPLLDRYLQALSGGCEETLHVLLSWALLAVTARARTILVLQGKPETGKSFFGRLLGALVGDRYFTTAQNDFFQTRFNSILANHRVVLIDEGEIATQQSMSNAKKYVEERYNPERKGVDADSFKKIHASMVVTSNNDNDFKFTPEERKFTVPDIGQDRMRNFFTKHEWDTLEDLLKDDQFLRNTFELISDYETDWRPTTDYQGETFWKLVVAGGLDDKDKAIYKTLEAMELRKPRDMRDFLIDAQRSLGERRTFTLYRRDVERLLSKFKHGGRLIGRIVEDDSKIESLIGQEPEPDLDLDILDGL